MEDMSEDQKAIAWLWVVEGLATMKQVDVSLLTDLLGEMGSALPDHMSKNARERVALRCLEELFGSSNNGMNSHVPSAHNSKVSFDLSQSCETVLKRITDETPEFDLRNPGPGLLKWDIHSFIVHKKAALPKCALKQLEESILDGSHPHADVLRGKSGLTMTSDADRVSANESNQSLNKSCYSAQNMGVEGNSENENLLLSERGGIGSDNEKRERVNDSDDWHIEAKKMKWDASYVSQSIEVKQNQISLDGRECLQDTSERHVPVSVSERCDVAENQMAMEQNRVEDGHSDYAASKRYGQSSDDAIHKDQRENHSNPTSVPRDTFQDKVHQYTCVAEAKDDGGLHCKLRVSNVAPLGETQHKISTKGFSCNSEHDAHIRVPLLSSTDESQKLSNADEGNGRDPGNMAGENLKRVNCSNDFHIRAKRREWDAYYVLQSIEQNQLPLYSEDSSERDVPVSESLRCDLAENQMEMMEEIRALEDGHDDYTESKRNGQSTYDATHQSRLENCCNAASMPQDTIQDEARQHTCVNQTKDDDGLQLELRASGVAAPEESQHTVSAKVFSDNTANDFHIKVLHPATTDGPQWKSLANRHKDDYEHCSKPSSSGVASLNETQQKNSTQQSDCVSERDSHIKVSYPAYIDGSQQKNIADKSKELMDFLCESETSNESDGFHDKKIDAAMKKHAFLRSQCTSSHDSLVTTVTEKNRSLYSNEGGQLLTCKTSNCPVVVHENWLRSSAISFEKGNFYCPFCSYALALTDYLEARKQTSLLKTGLNAFVHANLENRPMEPVGTVHSKVNNCSRHFEDNLLGKPYQNRHLEEREENQGNQCEEHVNEVDDVQFHNIIYDKQQGPPSSSCTDIKSMRGKVHVPAGEKEGEEKLVHECVSAGLDRFQNQVLEGDHLSSKNTQSLLVDQGQAGAVEVVQQHITDYSLRKRSKSPCTCTQLATTQSRKKKVPWTVEEEEMLKKGVQEFQCNDETRMPWKQIFEFGSDVFLSGRTPTDLKDKWRNICKGSPKSK
ncbi:uncharacterized protein LOC133723544 isoform X1 [Rosa rugosa]|uniref:uncharacterized protein LOC133723544 isoform X1 n=2 Tax=Rosa rugosa TaxID=74645 RepID=UPI002B4136F4|nr:uncharacterized protein LOC133723544 isoform X1 [Rosa rugosa]XP_062006375.1 uncharacterized protein LOC133723544 isoform X1 [Rosa rugosa]XP_062006376.1 uncharacterized protein LOC133723544 isoform X1 [Rosa rugosa]